jgi:hypothetical protein
MWSDDLTVGSTVNLTKAFLRGACTSFPSYKSPQDLYYRYLKHFLLVREDLNLGTLGRRARLEERLYKRFYRASVPLLEPAFVSIHNRHDVSRLAGFLNAEIVIFMQLKDGSFVPYHDYRSVKASENNNEEEEEEDNVDTTSTTATKYLIFKVSLKGALHVALNSKECLQTLDASYGQAVQFQEGLGTIVSRQRFEADDCRWAIKAIDSLLGFNDDDDNDDLHRSMGSAKACWDFMGRGESLHERWGNLVICCLVGMDLSTSKNSGCKPIPPKKYFFMPVVFCKGDVADGDSLWLTDNCRVVCFASAESVALLRPALANLVIGTIMNTTGLKENIHRSGVLWKPDGLVGRANVVGASTRAEALAHKRKQALFKSSVSHQRRQSMKKMCKCEWCLSEEFDYNMSKSGPERLVTTSYTARELCRMLGLDDTIDLEALFDRVSELSMASMDIESRTVAVDTRGPVDESTTTASSEYREFDKKFLEGHVRAVQKPIMIAHSDALDDLFHLTAPDDTEDSCYTMLASYWNHVEHRRLACGEKKASILLPVYEVLARYRSTYFRFARRWRDLDDRRRAGMQARVALLKQRRLKLLRRQRRLPQRPIAVQQQISELDLPWDAFFLPSIGIAQPPAATAEAANDAENLNDEDDDDEWIDSLVEEDGTYSSVAAEWPGSSVDVKFMNQVVSAWFHTVPGMLEKILDRLVSDYVVFSFYG